jgi:hypothetical protein
MRFPFLVVAAGLIAVPVFAQHQPRIGARTTSPQAMVAQMNPASPEEEEAQLIAAAGPHPLGSLANPIRVAGPQGERAYLARLRCADGTPARIGARSEAGVGPYGSVDGAYEVSCGAGSARLVFDMYQEEHAETRAPAGFTLAP